MISATGYRLGKFSLFLLAFFIVFLWSVSPSQAGPYGVATHPWALRGADLETTFQGMQNAGVEWVRLDFAWCGIEPSNNNFTFEDGFYDRIVASAVAHNLKIVGILDMPPAWANGASCDHVPPQNMSEWEDYVYNTVKRYEGQVSYWQVWNEPNTSWFYKPTPSASQYTSLLCSAYSATKRANPGAFLISGGLAPAATVTADTWSSVAPYEFLTQMYAAGAGLCLDGVGLHPYDYLDQVPSYKNLMDINGNSTKSIWLTEFGWWVGTSARAKTEAEQAAYLQDGYSKLAGMPYVAAMFWYNYRDECNNAAEKECNFGLLRNDYSPRPALDTYKQMATGTATTTPVKLNKGRLKRLYNPVSGGHLYTTNNAENNMLAINYGWQEEGVVGYLATTQEADNTPLYRLYSNGAHFYTSNAGERDILVTTYGWRYEGSVGNLAKTAAHNRTPYFRLYSPVTGRHFYTSSAAERDSIITNYGWNYEGVVGYLYS